MSHMPMPQVSVTLVPQPEEGDIRSAPGGMVSYVYEGGEWVELDTSEEEFPEVVTDEPGEITLPEVYPTQNEVYEQLLEAVRQCVASNVLRPVRALLEPTLGELSDVFDDSIIYREIGMDGSLDLFEGPAAIQQMLGKILHDTEVISQFVGDANNCLVNEQSMLNTNVRHTPEAHVVSLVHTMPRNELAVRYLRRTRATITTPRPHMMNVSWDVGYTQDSMGGVMYVAEYLSELLTVYYKLLTRFPSCQSSFRDLPGFRN